jgi:anionic cell wall polymer biosynthesis LytR-Cps2A-Psr (LCP) family protein
MPPALGARMLRRAALASLLIVLMTAGAVSAAGFLTADELINQVEKEGRAPLAIPEDEIDRAEAGQAQTIMLLGSDERYGDRKAGIKPLSDTILLVRLDPDKRRSPSRRSRATCRSRSPGSTAATRSTTPTSAGRWR